MHATILLALAAAAAAAPTGSSESVFNLVCSAPCADGYVCTPPPDSASSPNKGIQCNMITEECHTLGVCAPVLDSDTPITGDHGIDNLTTVLDKQPPSNGTHPPVEVPPTTASPISSVASSASTSTSLMKRAPSKAERQDPPETTVGTSTGTGTTPVFDPTSPMKRAPAVTKRQDPPETTVGTSTGTGTTPVFDPTSPMKRAPSKTQQQDSPVSTGDHGVEKFALIKDEVPPTTSTPPAEQPPTTSTPPAEQPPTTGKRSAGAKDPQPTTLERRTVSSPTTIVETLPLTTMTILLAETLASTTSTMTIVSTRPSTTMTIVEPTSNGVSAPALPANSTSTGTGVEGCGTCPSGLVCVPEDGTGTGPHCGTPVQQLEAFMHQVVDHQVVDNQVQSPSQK